MQPPPAQTPWQEIYRKMVGQLSTGGCLEPATLYLKVVETRGDPDIRIKRSGVVRSAGRLRARTGRDNT